MALWLVPALAKHGNRPGGSSEACSTVDKLLVGNMKIILETGAITSQLFSGNRK